MHLLMWALIVWVGAAVTMVLLWMAVIEIVRRVRRHRAAASARSGRASTTTAALRVAH